VVIPNSVLRSDNAVTLRTNGSTAFRRTQKQKLPFPFSKRIGGGEKKRKKRKGNFGFAGSLQHSKTAR